MNAIEDAQDRAYNLAHDIILAASHGDEAGAEALSKVFAIEIQTILNMGLQSPEDIS